MAYFIFFLIMGVLYWLMKEFPGGPSRGTTVDGTWERKRNKIVITYMRKYGRIGFSQSFTPDQLEAFLKKNNIPDISLVTAEMFKGDRELINPEDYI
jgi:hypothetical protein